MNRAARLHLLVVLERASTPLFRVQTKATVPLAEEIISENWRKLSRSFRQLGDVSSALVADAAAEALERKVTPPPMLKRFMRAMATLPKRGPVGAGA